MDFSIFETIFRGAMNSRNWLLAILAAVSSPAVADEDLSYGPIPSWANELSVPVKPKLGDAASVELLLWDTQIRMGPDGIETVVHFAARLNDPQALAAGNLSVVWAPAFDRATINSVKIIRGSEVIDPLAKGQKFTILRREEGLEQQTLDGRLTATMQAEGLQVGDIIELTQTIVHRDPTLNGHVEAALAAAYPARFEQARMRVVVPASTPISQRTTGGLAPATAQRQGRDQVYQWLLSPLQPDKPAENAPLRYMAGVGFEMTDYKSWNDLSATFRPLFEKAAAIPSSSPLRQEIERIRNASTDPKVQAAQALALVQGSIRYVNIALGVGGLVPADADVTWQRRFGDCKAKTVMLVGILRALGINATPVLVHTELGDGLDQRLPKISEFNHAIVRATIGGRDYWLDGTRIGDVSIDSLEPPAYKWALPLAEKAALVPIVEVPLSQPRREKIIVTDASNGVVKPVPTTLEVILRGDGAVLQNMYLNSIDAAHRDELMKKQLENQLDRFTINKVSSTYDPVTHTAILRAEGTQTLDIDNGTYWSETPSPGYKADFRRSSPRDVDAPVAIGFPRYERTVQTVVLPKSMASAYRLRPGDISTTLAGVEYKRAVTRKDSAVTIDTSNRSLVPEISIAEARAAEKQLRKLDNDNYYFTFLVAAEPTSDELIKLLGSAPKTASDYNRAAIKLVNNHEAGKAIAMLDKAVAASPTSFDPRFMRATLHAEHGEVELALADAAAAIKIQPLDPQARKLHAMLSLRQDNRAAALADADALAKADNAPAQLARAQIYAQSDRLPQALAAIDLAITYDPDPLTHSYRAELMPISDRAGRRRELDAAIKLNPRDPQALAALANLAGELGDYDKQLALLDQAFLLAPDDIFVRGQRAIALSQVGRTADATREFDAIDAKDLPADQWNNQCWIKAVANVELNRALDECDKSIAAHDGPAAHDSRALALLRLKRFDEAIKEFDLALASGDLAHSIYGRALAYGKVGRTAEAAAEAARATKLSPLIARIFAGYGIEP